MLGAHGQCVCFVFHYGGSHGVGVGVDHGASHGVSNLQSSDQIFDGSEASVSSILT